MSDSNKNHKRGEKCGILDTGRALKLDKTKDADADAAEDDDDEEQNDDDD